MLANMYASTGKWEEAAAVRKLMRDREIYEYLEEMGRKIRLAGYVPDLRWTLVKDVEIEPGEKEIRLGHHSEKRAVAFGLL
ncbi:hypothetical protein CRYUN_Cryun17cG0107800 [Craigia yunnanensis]